MIELTKETLDLEPLNPSRDWRRFKLFGITIVLWKDGYPNKRVWTTHRRHYSVSFGMKIDHYEKFTWHNLKRTLETLLNYNPSYLKQTLIKHAFKIKE